MLSAERATRGAGLLATTAGLLVLLNLLALATQVAVSLHVHTVVDAAADEAVRTVAGHRGRHSPARTRVEATERLRDRIGLGDAVEVAWSVGGHDDIVVLEVRARHPRVLPLSALHAVGLGATERRVEARVERWR